MRSRTLLAVAPLALSLGCSTGGHLVEPSAAGAGTGSAAPSPVAPAPDAFADFKGDKVDAGVSFRLDDIGRGVRGVEVVLRLNKVKTSSYTPPGGTEQVEGTAYIWVDKGQLDSELVVIHQGDEGRAHGALIQVHEAKVAYDDARMSWLPVAKVTVTAVP